MMYGMARPENWTGPAGGRPVRVNAGEPGGSPRFTPEKRWAKRGVKNLFDGSKRADRIATCRESYGLVRFTTGELSRSCHRKGSTWAKRRADMSLARSLRVGGYARTQGLGLDWRGPSPVHCQRRPSCKPGSDGVEREPDAAVVPGRAAQVGGPGKAPTPVTPIEVEPQAARRPGRPLDQSLVSLTRACTRLWALSATQRERNHAFATVGEAYAGERHVRIERGMGKRVRTAAHRAPDCQCLESSCSSGASGSSTC